MALMNQSLVVLLLAVAISYYTGRWPFAKTSIITDTLDDSYDYIVVGGGTAGSVLAARLSEDQDNKVLLLEAGGHFDESWKFHHPGYATGMLHTEFDWGYYTEPQRQSGLGLNGRRHYWPRGKVLGGSGIMNFMQYARGSRHDFDEWADNGCDGWSYKDVLPYFLKSEDILIDELKASSYHTTGGPVAVSGGKVTPLADLYAHAAEELGFTINDYNGEEQEGFGYSQLNIRNGVRSSTALEFLGGTADRNNLHIAVNSFAVRIGVQNKRATGVHDIRNGKKEFIKATKEVILSAGTINSPQLLMLSGIGPKEHLEEFNIPVIADLPVGKNLDDHIQLLMFNKVNLSYSITATLRESWSTRLKYSLFGTGPLAVAGTELTGFIYLDELKRKKSYPEIQILLFSAMFDKHTGKEFLNFKWDAIKDYFANSPNENGFIFTVSLTHPRSKGTIKLRSVDPYDHPVIDMQYLTDIRDVKDFIGGIRLWERFVQTPTMKKLGVNMENMKLALCAEHEFRTDAYWECVVRNCAITLFHHCGTCKMGADNDPSAVVDPKLKVKGIQGLRVVDASVFPKVVAGNINAPIVMLAEKSADIIRGIDSVGEYGKRFA